ncbi:MAG TPA: pyridoxal 5'-phosphate synthase glutaminase subunit PdxT [Candidatus Krumholzibacteria bacterium]|nr:pyridoxal 5'-phosphate synthase glutaminase subunit PdxT [Candidatus Krumholzibacteria bacterium]
MSERQVGVLALQGDFALHAELLAGLGVGVQKVRRPSELDGCDGLIVPGGESTTLRKLMARSGLDTAIVDFAREHAVLGTCAGCILLATDLVDAGGVQPLGLLDITVHRNAYGRQVDSFEAAVHSDDATVDGQVVSFIRAPRITRLGDGVEVWGAIDSEPVAVRSGRVSVSTFHPEVTRVDAWHRSWLESIG